MHQIIGFQFQPVILVTKVVNHTVLSHDIVYIFIKLASIVFFLKLLHCDHKW